jgi:hypothetical protein
MSEPNCAIKSIPDVTAPRDGSKAFLNRRFSGPPLRKFQVDLSEFFRAGTRKASAAKIKATNSGQCKI